MMRKSKHITGFQKHIITGVDKLYNVSRDLLRGKTTKFIEKVEQRLDSTIIQLEQWRNKRRKKLQRDKRFKEQQQQRREEFMRLTELQSDPYFKSYTQNREVINNRLKELQREFSQELELKR